MNKAKLVYSKRRGINIKQLFRYEKTYRIFRAISWTKIFECESFIQLYTYIYADCESAEIAYIFIVHLCLFLLNILQ